MGGDKDCEDFATACVSTINAIKRYSKFNGPYDFDLIHPMTPIIIQHVRTQFVDAFVTSGWVQVNIHKYTGATSDVKNEGHAWCSVSLIDGTYCIIECTTPILPHKQAHETKNTTDAQHVFDLYETAFNLTSKQIVEKDLGYGPAQLQPRERYKAIAYLYSDTCGYAVCKHGSSKTVGVTAKDFIANNISLIPLATQEIQDLSGPFRELDVNPDFDNTASIILDQINLHTRDVRSLSIDLGSTVLPIMPTSSVRFIPVCQLIVAGDKIVGELNFTTNGSTAICIYPIIISPTAQGFYVGFINETSITFNDTTV